MRDASITIPRGRKRSRTRLTSQLFPAELRACRIPLRGLSVKVVQQSRKSSNLFRSSPTISRSRYSRLMNPRGSDGSTVTLRGFSGFSLIDVRLCYGLRRREAHDDPGADRRDVAGRQHLRISVHTSIISPRLPVDSIHAFRLIRKLREEL